MKSLTPIFHDIAPFFCYLAPLIYTNFFYRHRLQFFHNAIQMNSKLAISDSSYHRYDKVDSIDRFKDTIIKYWVGLLTLLLFFTVGIESQQIGYSWLVEVLNCPKMYLSPRVIIKDERFSILGNSNPLQAKNSQSPGSQLQQ